MVSIKGIVITEMSINRDSEGKLKITGNYNLVSSTDKVLAKQSFNGYNDVSVAFTGDIQVQAEKALSAIKAELEKQLGLVEE